MSPNATTLTSRPMRLLRVDFADLYARHLCRHSQYGINVIHLAALFGIWFGVYSIVYRLTGTWWPPVLLAAAYWMLVAVNAPARVRLTLAMFLAIFVGTVLCLPEAPHWAYVGLLPIFYLVQSWSHKIYTLETDMTEFNKKYRKGFVLFIVLLINEVPLLLNFLCFDRNKRARTIATSNPEA
jgi:hypothetical protein